MCWSNPEQNHCARTMPVFIWRFIWGLLATFFCLHFPIASTQNKGCVSAQLPTSSICVLSLFCLFYTSWRSAALDNSNRLANAPLGLWCSLCLFRFLARLWTQRLSSGHMLEHLAQPSTQKYQWVSERMNMRILFPCLRHHSIAFGEQKLTLVPENWLCSKTTQCMVHSVL